MAIFDWPRVTGDNGNTYSTQATLPINLVEKYNPIVNGYVPSIIKDGTLYAVGKTDYNKLYAIYLSNNTVKWQFTTNETYYITSLLSIDNYVYALSGGKLYALEDLGASYSLKWTKEGARQVNYDESSLFYSSSEINSPPIVVAIDPKTGAEKFRATVGTLRDEIGAFAVGGGRLYFSIRNQMTDLYSKLYCISATTGQVLWTVDLGVYGIVSTYIPAYRDEKVYLDYEPPYQGRTQYLIAAFDAPTGRTLWRYDLKGPFSKIFTSNRYVVTSDSVITMSNEGYLIAINKDTGVERWRVLYGDYVSGRLQTTVEGATIAVQDKIILGANRKIKIFDTSNGALLRDISPADGSFRPVAAATNALITTDLQKLVLYAGAAPEADTTAPTANLDSVYPPRFSPYETIDPNTVVTVRLWEETFTQMEVINQNNQVIRSIDFGLLRPGEHRFTWNGLDNAGNRAPYGKYHFALQVRDPAGNATRYEYPNIIATIGDIVGKTLTNVNLRSGPGTEHSILTTIPSGTEVRILDEVARWYKVIYGGNYTGYVAKHLLSTYSNPAPAPTPSPTPTTYTVQAGDTLSKIASKFGVTVTEIVNANPQISNPNNLYIGQKLTIPVKTPPPTQVVHTVARGESLWAISQKYQVPMDVIIRANNLTNPNSLYVGQQLIIPTQGQPQPQIIHTVSSGETLWLISQKYQVPMSTIISNNNLVSPYILSVGQKLIIK